MSSALAKQTKSENKQTNKQANKQTNTQQANKAISLPACHHASCDTLHILTNNKTNKQNKETKLTRPI